MLLNFLSCSQEVAEPLQDLKEGMDQLEKNKTLRYILTTLLAIGNFLNGTNVSNLQDIYDREVPLLSLSLPVCLLLTSSISSHAPPPPPPPPNPPPTYLFGKDNSGLSMCRRMCCLTVCSRHCPSTVKTLVKALWKKRGWLCVFGLFVFVWLLDWHLFRAFFYAMGISVCISMH